jgi:hypothetical protein
MKMMKMFLVGLTIASLSAGDAAQAATFTAEGTLAATAEFTTRVFNTPDGSDNVSGILGFNAAAGATLVSSDQAIEIRFDNNEVGNQAVRVKTSNPSDAEGMIGVTDSSVTVPLMWVVTDDPISDPGNNNHYVFAGNTVAEAFVIDDSHPDVNTYANIAFGITGDDASLSNFPTDNGAGGFRAVSDGQIWVYFGANYTDKPAQEYRTTNLIVELYTQP